MAGRLPYIARATNNLANLGPHGWCCIMCYGHGPQHAIKDTCDDTTAICPICRIDTCVPNTPYNQKSLPAWRQLGFGSKYPPDFSQEDIDNFQAMVDHNAIDEPPIADPAQVMANQVEDLVLPAVGPAVGQIEFVIVAVAHVEDPPVVPPAADDRNYDIPQGNG